MAFRKIEIPDLGTIKLYKSRINRSIRLSITNEGTIRVTMPYWVPYQTGVNFAIRKQRWLKDQLGSQIPPYAHNQRVGKAHILYFEISNSPSQITSRVKDNSIFVFHPQNLETNDKKVQNVARTAVRRALKLEADSLLPQRLK